MNYETTQTLESTCCPGVMFTIRRMSFGRRLELTRQVRELAGRLEFARAGQQESDQFESAILTGEIDRLYLDWGLLRVEGLQLDGFAAEPKSLFDSGPEELCREIVAAIKRESGLTEEERKN